MVVHYRILSLTATCELMPDVIMLRKVIYEATSLKPMVLYGNYILHGRFFKIYRTRQTSANG
jgi:hypothetical protein